MKETKPIHTIKHGRVHCCYAIGISWIAIWTDTKTDWAEMPEYMRVNFIAINPNPEWADIKKRDFKTGLGLPFKEYERAIAKLERVVIAAIKKKTNEQRKADAGTVRADRRMGERSDKQEQEKAVSDTARKGRKTVAPMLPFESDVVTDAGTEII